jgi:NADPH2:quinone reductase
MPERYNRAHYLRRRPDGPLSDGDLELVDEPVGDLAEGQALVQTKLLSVDPTNRIWMSELRGYMPPVPLDSVMRGLGVGEIVESRRADLSVGDMVLGWTGWQEYCVTDDARLVSPFTVLPSPLPAPLGAFLVALGHTGITAWLGLEIGDPQPGETVVISAAAGAVGSVAVQLAKARGARVVGIAGGPEKGRHVTEELGADASVDRRAQDWRAQLEAATPDGIDVDFENVGGAILDAVLARLNIGARIALCGMVADYNAYNDGGSSGVHPQPNVGQLIMQRATITGFLVLDHAARFQAIIGELAGLLGSGALRAQETVIEGIEHAPEALGRLFTGQSTGKLLVHVAD